MPRERLVRAGRVEADAWTYVGFAADATPDIPAAGPIAVPPAVWQERKTELLARGEPVGVWLAPDEDPALLAGDLGRLALVAVHFPKFTDGRGYSIAALLRRRHGYRGELRAIGDVGRDQLFYMARVGFDAFLVAEHRDPHAALAAFDTFTVRYQGAVDEPLPLFRRRAAA